MVKYPCNRKNCANKQKNGRCSIEGFIPANEDDCKNFKRRKTTKEGYEEGFTQGVVWACARLIELFDEPTMALEILREASLKNLETAAEYDLAILRKEAPSIPLGCDA